MRLTTAQSACIKSTVAAVVGGGSRVWLFGSRADPLARGGDIDLLVECPFTLPNRAAALCRLHARLQLALGERKIDLLLKDACTPEADIHRAARTQGCLL